MFANRFNSFLFVYFLLLTSFAIANTTSSVTNNIPKRVLAIQHWVTSNGARVYFVATKQLPIIDIALVFDAGSARDDNLPGLANLTNNMLEEGTQQSTADQLANQFESVGAIFTTNVERDMATVSLRSLTNPNYLHPALQTLQNILFAPSFPAANLQRQQQQVLNQLKEQQQSLSAIASDAFYKALYQGSGYAHPVLGYQDHVVKITRQQLQDFYKQFYVAKNAVILLVGAVDYQQAQHIAEQLSQALPAGNSAPKLSLPTDVNQAKKVAITHSSQQTHITLGQLGITRHDPDYFPLMVGNYILGGNGLVSILNETLREKRGLTYGVYSYFMPMTVPGPFRIELKTPAKSTDMALNLTQQTLRQFIEQGPTEQQLTLAKQNLIGGFALRLDSNQAILANLMQIGFYQLPLDYLDTYKDKVKAVTRDQIRNAFQRRIHPEKMVTVLVGPRINE